VHVTAVYSVKSTRADAMREARTFLERLLLAAALPRGEMAGSVGMARLSVERSCRLSTICSFGIQREGTETCEQSTIFRNIIAEQTSASFAPQRRVTLDV
jgi:hypothetical protein